MKVMLDSNVWRYIADRNAYDSLAQCVSNNDVEIVVAPALVFEVRGLLDEPVRKGILRLLSLPDWTRLMPEVFLEAEEIKAAIRRFRPEWLIANPDMTEVERLKLDWSRSTGGFWSRAEADVAPPVTDESVRGDEEHRLARLESREIRERVLSRSETLPNINLRDVGGQPPVETPGWRGAPVAYWRVPSLYHIQAELSIYTSPYREWIDSEVDVTAILRMPDKLTELWYYQISATDMPRQWLRGAFEFLQAYHKVTPGNPIDSQLSSHLVDVDAIISADRNFLRFAELCERDAPFAVAKSYRVSGGVAGVDELLALLGGLPR